jgi:hypothetical protein
MIFAHKSFNQNIPLAMKSSLQSRVISPGLIHLPPHKPPSSNFRIRAPHLLVSLLFFQHNHMMFYNRYPLHKIATTEMRNLRQHCGIVSLKD